MTETLLQRCQLRGIALSAEGDRLLVDAPAGVLDDGLLAELRRHKAELLVLLESRRKAADRPDAPAAGDQDDRTNAAGAQDADPTGWTVWFDAAGQRWLVRPDQADIEELQSWPEPCPKCGSLELWEDLRGDWHCSKCEPPKGPRLRRLAAEIRRRHPVPDGDAEPRPKPPPWPPVVPDAIVAAPVPSCRRCGAPVICGQPGRGEGLCFECWIVQNRKGPADRR